MLENFLLKAHKIHGNTYDYSKVIYKGSKYNITIICPIHGEFEQTPQNHLRGRGCPICGKLNRKKPFKSNTEEFINKSKAIHGDIYDYSKVEYINSHTKVCIICPIHGEFYMTPSNHLSKQKCPKCQGKKLTLDDIISRCRSIHGDKYDYSKIKYNKMHDYVTIICPIHGEFQQTLSKHISKHQGCPKCGIEKRSQMKMMKENDYFTLASKIHNNKYDYSQSEYIGMMKKITYICPKHGKITQNARDHINGHGCYLCNESRLERDLEHVLMENNILYEKQKRFIWLGKQTLDFYLYEYNIAIECQGEQHFKPIEYFGGLETFRKIQELDKKKLRLCTENNIKLFYWLISSKPNDLITFLHEKRRNN